tara:strand:- start:1176 stop:1748 length:573 start_codon:yes stop_codon:yes gene_type:complete
MADCASTITEGIGLNCEDINAAIGVDKDLHLYNYADFKRAETLDVSNIEGDDTNSNIGGLSSIFVGTAVTPHVFEGTDYSVQPSVSSEIKEDGNSWFIHSVLFTAYNKGADARAVIEDLGKSKVVAVCVDRSTGLFELFGADQGLKLSAVERAYTGTQTSNFYQVTLATPDIAVVRESSLGLLAVSVNNS